MSSGRFTAVVHGTWETSSSVPVLPVVAAALAAAAIAWLMTVLWLIAAMLGVLVTLAFGGLVVIRRYNRRETGRFVERMGVLAEAEQKRPVAAPAPQALTVNHFHGGTHLHLTPREIVEGAFQAIPHQDAITITTEGD